MGGPHPKDLSHPIGLLRHRRNAFLAPLGGALFVFEGALRPKFNCHTPKINCHTMVLRSTVDGRCVPLLGHEEYVRWT